MWLQQINSHLTYMYQSCTGHVLVAPTSPVINQSMPHITCTSSSRQLGNHMIQSVKCSMTCKCVFTCKSHHICSINYWPNLDDTSVKLRYLANLTTKGIKWLQPLCYLPPPFGTTFCTVALIFWW